MPAKSTYSKSGDDTYCHVYNRGVEKRNIFESEADYDVFISYLKEYLSPPPNHQEAKKDFTVNGRKFRGVPHQPKNYHNRVELVAYSFGQNNFHLVINEIEKDALQAFMRSLCTRYSMYFNKKYERTGPLFEGPYKSINIEGDEELLVLTSFLHQTSEVSSYPEYLNSGTQSWLRPHKPTENYKEFVESHKFSQKEEELLRRISFENGPQETKKVNLIVDHLQPDQDTHLRTFERPPEFALLGAIFLVLLHFGLQNINVSTRNVQAQSSTPSVAGVEIEEGESEKPKVMVAVKTTNPQALINIREEPNTNSDKIGEAVNGDVFEFISTDSEWYEVKLSDNLNGFISAQFIEVLGEIIQ